MRRARILSRAMCKPGGVPERVDYRRYAVQGRTIEGTVPLACRSRLVAAVYRAPAADTVARLRLAFAEDTQRRVRVSGRITAPVVLQCQRCSAAFEYVIDTPIAGIVVTDDAGAAGVPKAGEPIMADGDTLDVQVLAEDELLLALPLVARCDRPACRARYNDTTVAAHGGDAQRQQGGNKPFSVLQRLKHHRDTD